MFGVTEIVCHVFFQATRMAPHRATVQNAVALLLADGAMTQALFAGRLPGAIPAHLPRGDLHCRVAHGILGLFPAVLLLLVHHFKSNRKSRG